MAGVAAFSASPEGRGIRVLAAEDNPVFQSMLRSMLAKWGYDPVIARDGLEAWRALDSDNAPRLAILDWMMPGLDGVEICRRVRAAAREPYIYLVLLTARSESQDLVEGMEAGADDYLTKPFVAQELRVRLRAGRRILDLQSELMAAREALRVQATHDALTGIPNRAAILDALHTELSRASRERGPVAVLMSDVDRFKSINDAYGHQTGDDILREAAQRMKIAPCAHTTWWAGTAARSFWWFWRAAMPRALARKPSAFERRSPWNHFRLGASPAGDMQLWRLLARNGKSLRRRRPYP